MLINDLSYCEVVEENVIGGFGFSKNVSLKADTDIVFDLDIDLDVDKNVDLDANSDVHIPGIMSGGWDLTDNGYGCGEPPICLFVVDDPLIEAALLLVGGVS